MALQSHTSAYNYQQRPLLMCLPRTKLVILLSFTKARRVASPVAQSPTLCPATSPSIATV
jgi:hypothetical protein